MNNANRSVLVLARLGDATDGPLGLYRFAEGNLKQVAVPGQSMPGRGTLNTIQRAEGAVSHASETGQHAFVAELADGSTGVYVADAEGRLFLVLATGAQTELGTLTAINPYSAGVGLNRSGQVAVALQIDYEPEKVVLLSPATR